MIDKKRVLITGIYGQDGSYLCEQLTQQGYEVHGICRETLNSTSQGIKDELLAEGISPIEHYVSLYDYKQMKELIDAILPDVIFHMAAVHRSAADKGNVNEQQEKELFENNITATHNVLTICCEGHKKTKVLTAGSCLMFDGSDTDVQSEATSFCSDSLYGIAKIAENNLVSYYRQRGVFACQAILYNHESHRRSTSFVTRKIVLGLKDIAEGKEETLELGSIDSVKDWGFAGDYTKAMQMMIDSDVPQDYIVSTGQLHTIADFVSVCADHLGISDWRKHIILKNDIVFRKIKGTLKGDSTKIQKELGWKPNLSFYDLVMECCK